MALTKVSRGLLTTSIVDNGNATAITIDASENVGVGNTSPSSYFSNARNLVVGGTTGANGMTISGSTDTQIFFADGTSGADAYRGIIRYSHADNGFSFWTNATRSLDIDSAGRVGISTTDPKSTLEVKGTFGAPATSGFAAGFISRFSQSSGVGCLDFGFGDAYSWLQSRASNNYGINYNLVLQPNGGNVGIGTSNPDTTLHLQTPSGTKSEINFAQTAVTNYRIGVPASTDALVFTYGASTERMRIAGSTGISYFTSASSGVGKIANPGSVAVADDATVTLHTGGTLGAVIIHVYEQGTGDGGIYFVTYKGQPVLLASNGSFVFATSDTDGAFCIIKASNNHTVTFKNRTGATRGLAFLMTGANL